VVSTQRDLTQKRCHWSSATLAAYVEVKCLTKSSYDIQKVPSSLSLE